MDEKWYCNTCDAVFGEPSEGGLHKLCPYCYSVHIERMERCPTCDGGWKVKSEHVCRKCHLRNVSEIRVFAQRWSPATLEDMSDILEGNGLVMFT